MPVCLTPFKQDNPGGYGHFHEGEHTICLHRPHRITEYHGWACNLDLHEDDFKH